MTTPSAATAMSRVRLTAGLAAIAIGFVTYALSRAVDSGFVHGFFQGATLALMVAGAYLVGAAMWHRRSRGQGEDDRHWLPSRDGADDGPAPDTRDPR
ncbi:hypothetical protein [uncultured Serinicoccus sp.]|uniref:hypothetical protein n=1 Tax=uncultured Serinicoccus sp. TaxID=735514 RepID=UPI0026300474|nr:hypothetical protein [uncultured Serinicoccus sp.]